MASAYIVSVYLIVAIAILSSPGIGAKFKDKVPHAPFPDLHENLSHDPDQRIFSEEELSAYNGQNPEMPLYMSVRGVVFDVTQGKDFYGAGKSYNVFTGKDASRAIAKQSLASEDITADIVGLSKEEYDHLEEMFQNVYMKKYPVVGYLRGFEPQLEENLVWKREDL